MRPEKSERKKSKKNEKRRRELRGKKTKKKAGERITKIRERKRESSKIGGKVEGNKLS